MRFFMNSSEEQDKIIKFIKIGIFIMSTVLVFAASRKIIPTFIANASSKKLPIYCVNTEEKKVALSFDAAWGNEDTKELLSILAKHNVRVTFFMTGSWIEKYPEDVKAIAAAGHDVGNHSENHKQMSQLDKQTCITELQKPHEKVKQLIRKDMTLFRPPYGDYNNTVIEAVNSIGYHCVQWDVDTLRTEVKKNFFQKLL